jgi:neutral ceramidase
VEGYVQDNWRVSRKFTLDVGVRWSHMGYAPEGPSDKTVAVVSFTNAAGEPIAVYSNYPVHAVVMFRVKSRDGKVEVTGDIAGATSAYVEDHFKNAVALWTSGAAGDQNPLFMANHNQDAPDVHDEGPAGWAILDVEARRLGEEIVRVTNPIKNTSDRVTICGKQTSVTCPGQKRAEPPKPEVPRAGWQAPPSTFRWRF